MLSLVCKRRITPISGVLKAMVPSLCRLGSAAWITNSDLLSIATVDRANLYGLL
jgi:hypothetical protein